MGPRIVLSGKALDGIPLVFPPDQIAVRDSAEAVRVVDSLAARGVDFIKLYEMLPRDVFVAAAGAAKRHGLPVAVLVPFTVDASEASELGVSSFEHLRNIELACSGRAASLRLARTEVLAREAAKPESVVKALGWSQGYGSRALVRGAIHAEQRPRALHEELSALVAAGLTTQEALQAATTQPARFFEASDSFGSAAPGHGADLILLDADPLLDIKNTRRIRGVVLNGRYLDRAELDSLLQSAAVAAAGGH